MMNWSSFKYFENYEEPEPTDLPGIISKYYNQNDRRLNLSYKNQWFDVLLFKDWPDLVSLYLESCRFEDSNAADFKNIIFPCLEYLNLSGASISAEGIKELIKSKWAKLKQLNFNYTNIKDQSLQLILERQFSQLQELYLTKCNFSSKGLKKFPDCKMNSLIRLSLSESYIGSYGVKLFVKADIQQLEYLWLNNCKIGKEGSKFISKGKWPKLKKLGLNGNLVKASGSSLFVTNDWKHIEEIWIDEISAIFSILFVTAVQKSKTKTYKSIKNKQFNSKISKIMVQRFPN